MKESYEKLASLPLFLGISESDLERAAGQTRFDFRKYDEGDVIVSEGATCDQLLFLLQGELRVTSAADDKAYRMEEYMAAPNMIQPERLYGLRQRYTMTISAHTPCSMMTLRKKEIARLCANFELVRINLLNILCTKAQRALDSPWHTVPGTIRERIVRFMTSHCTYPAGKKRLHIHRERLREEIGASQRELTRTLMQMEEEGLLKRGRQLIEIDSMERLLMK